MSYAASFHHDRLLFPMLLRLFIFASSTHVKHLTFGHGYGDLNLRLQKKEKENKIAGSDMMPCQTFGDFNLGMPASG